MFKKAITILTFLILVQTQNAYAFIDIAFTEDEPQSQAEQTSLLDLYSGISLIEQQIYELELDIKFLKEPSSNPLEESLNQKIDEKEKLINADESSDEEIAKLNTEINEIYAKIDEDEKSVKEELIQKESDLQKTQTLLEKTKEITKERAYELAKKIAIYSIGIFLFLLLGQFAKRTINNNQNFIQTRKDALGKFINTAQIIVISIITLSLFFSKFATLIPILALVGTGLAFAIRDVILSLLAWFFIGTKARFKLNDLIQIGEARGRVLNISLLHTTLRETGESGPTGRIVSFPNKKIFEESLQNFSGMYQFTWVILDFYLEKNSNTKLAKRKMLESINEVAEEDISEVHKNLPSFAKKFGLNEETTAPQIYFSLEEKGIHTKVKVLTRLSNKHNLKTKISETFLEKIKDDSSINLRFLVM